MTNPIVRMVDLADGGFQVAWDAPMGDVFIAHWHPDRPDMVELDTEGWDGMMLPVAAFSAMAARIARKAHDGQPFPVAMPPGEALDGDR